MFEGEKEGFRGGVVRSRFNWLPKSLSEVKIDLGSGFMKTAGLVRLPWMCRGLTVTLADCTQP
jgi:hypothetical protein